jgi:hypothetical protein
MASSLEPRHIDRARELAIRERSLDEGRVALVVFHHQNREVGGAGALGHHGRIFERRSAGLPALLNLT